MSQTLTHKRVLSVALPIVLSNATIPILGAVDTGVVGQLGDAVPIGAVGIGAIIISGIYWMFGFLRMGTTGLTAQAIGEKNVGETAALLTRTLIIGVAAGLLVMLLQIPLFWLAFKAAPATPEVETMAHGYMQIRIYSAPAAIGLYGITGWLLAHERTRAVLVLQVWMNGLNIVLDLLFVLQFGWGVEGVAIATFLAEWSGFALGIFLARDVFGNALWRNWEQVFDRIRLTRMAIVNSDIMLRSMMLKASFMTFLFMGARFGNVTLAANQVLLQFMEITAYAMDGFAISAEALVGQALGAKNRNQFRRSVYLSCFWGVAIISVMALMFWLCGGWVIDVMTNAADVRIDAREYLPWMVLAPIAGVTCWMLDGVFIGATRSKDMRNMMFLSVVIYIIALYFLVPVYGNHGLWAALNVLFIARGVTLAWKYPALEASVEKA
ncbi:MATE family efflux transporter [Amylibacter sp. SFDW26]|uniref:MATE family efflux transporter n=1 Tax=Amylibacter sp. SFDW26 TaxID=2652722 RepID=UPI0012614B63|nr:MATE family efflux transporter [Amylibacter sp. SFDW26]KAB7613663.1 MATE family efflux transporter [Amylibacter sp. SFDW26]